MTGTHTEPCQFYTVIVKGKTMKIKIVSISMSKFKGYKDKVLTLNDSTEIVGENGVGKTTILTAHMWLWADRDADLKSNPDIFPIGAEEVIPRVEEVIDLDGKTITVAKQQKRTVSKPNADGVSRISLTNSFEINSVPKSERDFRAYFEELGVNLDLFLPLSHTDVFTSQKAVDMRKVLFQMANDLSDKDVAGIVGDIPEVIALLDNYTAEEIKAMQNATLRKINEEYGRNGEILRAKIEGLESAMQEVNVGGLAEEKASLEKRAKENTQEIINGAEATADALKTISNDITNLRAEYSEKIRSARESYDSERRKIDSDLLQLQSEMNKAKSELSSLMYSFDRRSKQIEEDKAKLFRLRDDWNRENAHQMDADSLVCPTCGSELPEEMKKETLKKFEQNKQNNLQMIADKGSALNSKVRQMTAECDADKTKHDNIGESIKKWEKELKKLEIKRGKLVEPAEPEECAAILEQIEKKEKEMRALNTSGISDKLSAEREKIQKRIGDINAALQVEASNKSIAEKIAALRDKQNEYEQSRADCERILYQLDLISRKKNELLEDSINSHFKMVKFRLFTYLKNGNYAEDCTPMIDGKSINSHSNGALRTLAKLDIIDGLQRFYGQYYPVIADDFALVTNNTATRISMECQLIRLQAVHGVPLMVR